MSNPQRAVAPVSGARGVAGAVFECVALLDETTAERVSRLFVAAGITARLHHPRSTSDAVEMISRLPIAAVLTNHPQTASSADTLSVVLPIRWVGQPPVFYWHDQPLEAEVTEELRLAGIAAVVRPQNVLTLVRALGERVPLRSQLEMIPLDSLLQTIENQPGKHLIAVECPHWPGMSERRWQEGAAQRCSGRRNQSACPGWYGRVYLADGELLHVETPGAEGYEALAQLLEMKHGVAHVQPALLLPARSSLGGKVQQGLLRAAALVGAASAPGRDSFAEEELADFSDSAGFDSDPSGSQVVPPLPDADSASESLLPQRGRSPALPGETPTAENNPAISPWLESAASARSMPAAARSAEQVRAAVAGLQGFARCDASGWIEELDGAIDAESLCATVVIAREPLEKAGAIVGLGELESWAAGDGKHTAYVVVQESGYWVAESKASKGPEVVLRKLRLLVGGGGAT